MGMPFSSALRYPASSSDDTDDATVWTQAATVGTVSASSVPSDATLLPFRRALRSAW